MVCGSDEQFYTSAFSGQSTRVDRKTSDEPRFIERPFVSITGGLQPKVLSKLGADQGTGFYDRFLIAYPDHKPTVFDRAKTIPPEARAEYEALYRGLLRLEMQPAGGAERLEPVTVWLSNEAMPLFDAEINRIYAEKDDPGMTDLLKGVWTKLSTYFARFCLILAVCREVERWTGTAAPVHHPSTAENAIGEPKTPAGWTGGQVDGYPHTSDNHGGGGSSTGAYNIALRCKKRY